MVHVELIYSASSNNLIQLTLCFENSVTIAHALEKSGVFTTHPETKNLKVGIFSKPAQYEEYLKNGDRLEIYRELSLDPMEKRRQQAKIARKLKIKSRERPARNN